MAARYPESAPSTMSRARSPNAFISSLSGISRYLVDGGVKEVTKSSRGAAGSLTAETMVYESDVPSSSPFTSKVPDSRA